MGGAGSELGMCARGCTRSAAVGVFFLGVKAFSRGQKVAGKKCVREGASGAVTIVFLCVIVGEMLTSRNLVEV